MPAGSVENISGGVLVIKGLGWRMPTGYTEAVDSDTAEQHHWLQAVAELSALVTSTDIEILDQNSNVVPANLVENWVNDVDVTTAPPSIPLVTYVGSFRQRVPNNGALWMAHNQSVTHTEVGFIIPGNEGVIRTMFFGSKDPDTSNTYDFRIYSDPAGSPTLVVNNVLVTDLNVRTKTVENLNIILPAGEYGMRLVRVTGSGRSDFNQGLGNVICEIR